MVTIDSLRTRHRLIQRYLYDVPFSYNMLYRRQTDIDRQTDDILYPRFYLTVGQN